jgi:hypothetical protein
MTGRPTVPSVAATTVSKPPVVSSAMAWGANGLRRSPGLARGKNRNIEAVLGGVDTDNRVFHGDPS